MNRGMKKHVSKAAACFVTGALFVAGGSMGAMAAGTSLVGVGAVQETAETEAVKEAAEAISSEATAEAEETVQEETVQETEASMVGTIAVALPGDEEFFNIRSSATAESDVVGYLYDNNFASIIGEEGDWYLVQSGNCVGYVAKYLLTTGEDAVQAVQEVATPVAQVNASALMVRADASEDAEVVDMVTEDQIIYLEEDLGGWAKVSTGNATGYVSADYVSYGAYLPQAESQEEAQARVAQEEAEYAAWLAEQEQLYLEALAAEQAAWEAQNQAWIEYLQSQGQYADEAQAAAEQAAANQEWADQAFSEADAALSEAYEYGDEETIAAAEEAYQEAAQVAADAAYAAEEAQAEADAADQTFTEIVADAGIDVSEVTVDTDSDDSEATGDSTGTTSSARQAIVDYALQFVGNPYVYGGTSLTNGTDCSGFTQGVLANFDININRTAGQQAQGGTAVDLDDIQPGDLLFYSGDGDYGIGHVSMYIGNGQVVHASSSTTGIIVSDINYRTPTSAANYID